MRLRPPRHANPARAEVTTAAAATDAASAVAFASPAPACAGTAEYGGGDAILAFPSNWPAESPSSQRSSSARGQRARYRVTTAATHRWPYYSHNVKSQLVPLSPSVACSAHHRKYRRNKSRRNDLPVRKAPTTETTEIIIPSGTWRNTASSAFSCSSKDVPSSETESICVRSERCAFTSKATPALHLNQQKRTDSCVSNRMPIWGAAASRTQHE